MKSERRKAAIQLLEEWLADDSPENIAEQKETLAYLRTKMINDGVELTRMNQLPGFKRHVFKEKMLRLQLKHAQRQRPRRKLINPVKRRLYDDVYYEGIVWLNTL